MPHSHTPNIKAELQEKHFRVTIFGSARIKKDDETYKQVYTLAHDLGKHDFDIITGGGPGLMEAANSGHRKGKLKAKKNGTIQGRSHSMGLTIELPFEAGANSHLDIHKHFRHFSERLDHFMILSNVVIVMPGGIGTCLELFYTWQLTQVKHICSMPIIVIGEMWKKLIKWVEKYPLGHGLVSPHDLHNIYVVRNIKQACNIIQKAYEIYKKEGDSYCLNYKKYKLD